MSDTIEYLEQREDVKKTEYIRVNQDRLRRVNVEMWHDAEGLHKLFEKARTRNFSEEGMMDEAANVALAVRKTEVDGLTRIKALHDDSSDYKYKLNESE